MKCVTAPDETVAQLAEVLHDSIVNDRYTTSAVEMGMRIGLSDAAVGCPAGMTEADIGHWEIDMSVGDFAGSFLDTDVTIDANRNAP